MCSRIFVFVSERERERERESGKVCKLLNMDAAGLTTTTSTTTLHPRVVLATYPTQTQTANTKTEDFLSLRLKDN